MKVERKEMAFKPITVTLETKEEATHLWHYLKINPNLSRYCDENGLSFEMLDDFTNNLLLKLNDHFNPKEKPCE